ncbi:MAG: aspartate kinase [Deltaproteobacteria bacterium RBG_13_65_10]|nr:MAG: aspartate kinase [Deltaproteobacteria bacterium RBG_13_65_10]
MALIVQKYGGTSVGDPDRIKRVAERVIRTKEGGHRVAVVVSAMAGETNRLVALVQQMAEAPDEREMDVILSTGEQVTIGLLAIALKARGHGAKSFTGSQVRILTDSAFTKARIQKIDDKAIHEALARDEVVVVAGFQGIDEHGNITTLGRGGSDTSAVALAAALGADVCEIYTDVDGVYTTDPNIVPTARKLDRVSYDEMLEMASLGAKVLQTRSVLFAKKYNVPIHVRSSFNESEGTLVTREEDIMEALVVSGVTYNRDEAKITVVGVPDQPGVAAKLFGPITARNIVIDMIVQNVGTDGRTDLTFTVPKTDFKKSLEIVQASAGELKARTVLSDDRIAKVSIIGMGMKNHAGVASRMFELLACEGINIQMISTSEIKVSCVIEDKYTELAVRALHDGFGMGKEAVRVEKLP